MITRAASDPVRQAPDERQRDDRGNQRQALDPTNAAGVPIDSMSDKKLGR